MRYLLLVALFVFSLQAIIEPQVFEDLKAKNGRANVNIQMKRQVDWEQFTKEHKSLDDITKGRVIVDTLMHNAEETQDEVRRILQEEKITFDDLWINNILAAKNVNGEVLAKLSQVEEIERIWSDREEPAKWEEPEAMIYEKSLQPEWGLGHIHATKAWEKGFNGTGIVLGIADSGVNYAHSALVKSYRGNKGDNTFDHAYNWFDPTVRARTPVDEHSHGTHVSGTVAGGFDRKIGVAPGSKWIHCRIASRSFVPSNVLLCMQFLLAPFDLDQKNPNPDKRPHTSSHSYTCNSCRLSQSMKALKAAGVYVIAAAGNSGPRCSSMLEPAVFPESLTVGALGNRVDTIAGFSSRGPVPNLQKPEIVAPGTNIVSASNRGGSIYTTMSGTSMATPMSKNFYKINDLVNGAIGVIWSAVPELVRKIDETNKIIAASANHQKTKDCSSPKDTPNNVYGYGTINVIKAIELARQIYQKK